MFPVPYEKSAVADLVEVATHVDGHPPFSGHKLESIGRGRTRTGAWSDDMAISVVGVAAFHQSDRHWTVEIAVSPEHRGRRMEEIAIRLASDLVPDGAAHTIWAFRTDQIEAARRLGYIQIRAVVRMAGPLPEQISGTAPGVTIGAMVPSDIGGIVAVNNRAFLDHPEQGAMTEEGFASLADHPWFNPDGVLVAKAGEHVAGFCITKREGGRIGEIVVIAVDPAHQHSGIGRDLVQAGSGVLRKGRAQTLTLWVDSSNDAAIRLYASLGLTEDFRTREFALS
jgi:mycothiol synthase